MNSDQVGGQEDKAAREALSRGVCASPPVPVLLELLLGLGNSDPLHQGGGENRVNH